ncbi:MAG: XrtA/PEP-CTERM system TPR-repeat protein PrsT [Chromatocurvus sp.]
MSVRNSGALLIAGVLTVLLAACGESLTEEELLARAGGALAGGNANAAIVDAKTALQQNADNPKARRLLGEALKYQGDLINAEAEFERSLQSAKDPDVAVLLGEVLLASGQHARFMERYEAGYFDFALEYATFLAHLSRAQILTGDGFTAEQTLALAKDMAPDLPEVLLAEAVVLARHKGDLDAAEILLERLIEAHPEYPDGWSLYGNLQQVRGDRAAAEAAFAEAVRLGPGRLEDLLSQVAMLVEQEKYAEAKKAMGPLQRRVPDHPGVNYAQARIALADGNNKEALERLDAVFNVLPRHLPSLYLAANLNFREGSLATAESQLATVLSLQPRNTEARRMLGAVMLRRGENQRAEKLARALLEESPMNVPTLGLLALALSAQGQHAESAEVYQQQADLQPESADVRMALGGEWVRAGEIARGIAELERARDLDPDNQQVRASLAQAYMVSGEGDTARREVEEFRALAPDSAVPSLLFARLTGLEGDTSAASAYLREALELDPSNDQARQGLAALAMQSADSDTALEVFDEGLKADPENLSSLLGRAEVQEQRGDIEGMVATLKRAVDAHPEASEARLRLARHYLQEGRPGLSVDLLSGIEDPNRDNAQVQQLSLGAYLALEQYGPAVTAGRKLQILLPEEPVALRLAAQAEGANGDLPRAERLLRRAHELDPDDVATHKMLIETLMLQNKLEETGEELGRLAGGASSEPQVKLARGRIAMTLGRPREAESLIREAHEAQPSGNSVLFLSASLLQQGKAEEAVTLLEDWVEEHPEDPRALERLGALLLASGRDQRAMPLFEKLNQLAPESVVALNNLAWTKRESDPAQALILVRKAAELAPDNAAVLDTQALVLLGLGEFGEALEVSQRALEASPDNPQYRLHRARILAAAGENAQAIEILQSLVDGRAFAAGGEARELLEELEGR